jgi:D-alanyl-D-alanine carboxypeptidase
MGFVVGTSMPLDSALKMMLVPSANDIAVAISETVGGTEAHFVAEMNATARSLGMNSTHYDNPNGLPSPGQLTTARDLAVLARAILHTFPEYGAYFRIQAIKAGPRILHSENALLERYPGATGMKTGFICDSGFNTVASATRSGRTLIVVVLGAPTALSRAKLAAKLLDGGFSGGSFGFTHVELASFHASPSTGRAVNLHDSICGRQRPHPLEKDADVGDISSALGPPITTKPLVVVYTDPGRIAKVDSGKVPLCTPCATATPAASADLSKTSPSYVSPAAAPIVWTGFYTGVEDGYDWGSTPYSFDNGVSSGNSQPSGGLGGAYAGYDFETGRFVTGLEGDSAGLSGSFSNPSDDTSTGSARMDWDASLRARFDAAFGPSLPYLTGGVAFAGYKFTGGPLPTAVELSRQR